MQIRQERWGPLGTNTYLVWDEPGRDALLIDPAGKKEQLAQLLAETKVNVRYIVLTHGHADHVSGLQAAKDMTAARILIHLADAPMLQDTDDLVSRYLGVTGDLPPADALLHDGDRVDIGGLSFRVLHTPGHTRGGICLWGEGVLFSGDTLFAGSMGRYDLPGGDLEQLKASLCRLKQLPEETLVYPGHGQSTNIGAEKNNNRFIQEL